MNFIADQNTGPSRSPMAPDLVHSVHTGTQAHGVASLSIIVDLMPGGKEPVRPHTGSQCLLDNDVCHVHSYFIG